MKNPKILTVIVALQALILAGQWLGSPSFLSSAQAQADPGRDRQQMVDELRSANAKLDKLIDILGSGNLQVRMLQSDDNKGKAAGR